VVGGVLALATWIYLSAQIVFFGATFTRVHCELKGCPAARARNTKEHDVVDPQEAVAE